MAGTLTEVKAEVRYLNRELNPVACYELQWTATAGGVVSESTNRIFNGVINRIVTDPGASVAETYTLTVTDRHGVDLMDGAGTALSASATEEWPTFQTKDVGGVPVPYERCVDSVLTITIGSVTPSSSGSIFIYVR